MNRKSKSRLKIIWAVDAYGERDKESPNASAWALRTLGKQIDAEIEPVYVLSLVRSRGMTLGLPQIQPYLSRTEEALRSILRKTRIPKAIAPRIIMTGSDSNAVRATSLARHARTEHADLIVVGSHARTGAARLFLGSFAESLMLWTPAPLLIVNPTAKASTAFKRVLFATDFSNASRKAFRGLLKLAMKLRARIEVLHVIEPTIRLAGVYVPGPNADSHAEPERARRDAIKRIEVLLADARRAGVPATANIFAAHDDSVSNAILEATRRSRAQLIAIAAQSEVLRAAFIGSVARQVVRGAACPVMVLRHSKR